MKKIKPFIFTLVTTTAMLLSTYMSAGTRAWHIELKTNKGTIVMRLYDETPLHRDNFVKLVKKGYYNGILFHRVINNFMIQSGDPDSKERLPDKLYGDGGPKVNIPAEFVPELFHKRGVVAAAREGDNVNPKRESSASQFYIVEGVIHTNESLNRAAKIINDRNRAIGIESNYDYPQHIKDYYKQYGGTPHLDTQYTVFGEVVSGMEVVFNISDVETNKNDRPLEDIFIISSKAYRKKVK